MAADIAIVGTGNSILAFKAAGVDAYQADSAAEAKELVRKAAKVSKVILLADVYAAALDEWLKRFLEQPYPIVVPIPTDEGSNGYAANKLKEEMERALGVNVLGREDK